MAVKFTYSTRPKVFVAVGLIDQQSDNGEASAFRYMLFETRSQLKVNLMSVPWYYSSVEQNPVHGLEGQGDTATEFDTLRRFSHFRPRDPPPPLNKAIPRIIRGNSPFLDIEFLKFLLIGKLQFG